jgi:hypothetical protein
MVYDPTIPQSTDLISASQAQILANFAAIDSSSTGFAVDHVTLTDASNGGKHKKMTMVQQGSAPTTGVSEVALYTKALSGAPEMYLRRQSNGTEVLMTRGAPTASSGEGVAYGGLQIRASSGSISSQSQAFTFSSAFSTACLAVMVTNASSGSNASYFGVVSYSTTGFTLFQAGGTLPSNFTYIAVGY